MEIEHQNDDHGGFAELESGNKVDATLRIINDDGIRIDLSSEMRNGCLSLGINLSPDEAQRVSEYLAAQATVVQENQ